MNDQQPHKSQVNTSAGDAFSPQGSHGSTESSPQTCIPAPAKPVLQVSKLDKCYFVLPQEGKAAKLFVDRKLPLPQVKVVHNEVFTSEYFVALHKLVAAPGPSWPAGTPNYMGARIPSSTLV